MIIRAHPDRARLPNVLAPPCYAIRVGVGPRHEGMHAHHQAQAVRLWDGEQAVVRTQLEARYSEEY